MNRVCGKGKLQHTSKERGISAYLYHHPIVGMQLTR